MKFIFSENIPIYTEYLFPYSIYAVKEETDSIEQMYQTGLLPTRIKKDLYYLARSLRIDLSQYTETSELRRIGRKTGYLKIEVLPLEDFKYDYSVGKLAVDFYKKRFGKGTMSAQKIKWAFTSGAYTHVAKYTHAETGEVIGYCILMMTTNMMHYAYPFYDLTKELPNLGIGMMKSAIDYAKDNGSTYVYLGSVYTEQSLYKVQFPGVEYFTGHMWNNDIKALKHLIRNGQSTNMFKDSKEKEMIIDQADISLNRS